MKNGILPAVFLFLSVFSFAQTKSKPVPAPAAKPKPAADPDLQLYGKAIGFADYEVAKLALYNLILRYPDSLNYLDSLVTLYFSIGQMPQCILAGNQYILRDTTNLTVLEMVAVAYAQLNKNKEALDVYNRMFLQTGNIYYAYQTAVQQYYLKRIGECNQMIDLIVSNPKSEEEKISIRIDQSRQQQVPLKAAALNLRGIILKELNMPGQAKAAFEESLKVMPEFSLAKGNLDDLSKGNSPQKDPAAETKEEPKK